MSRRQLFARLLVKAAWVRKDRALTALVAVAVVATIATAGLTVYYDLENKLSHEFQSFGANVVITARRGSLDDSAISSIRGTLAGKGEVVPVAYAIVDGPGNTRVVIGGANLRALGEMNSWWSTRKVDAAGNALLGSRAAGLYSSAGGSFDITYGTRKVRVQPEEIFTSGADDDSRIYLGPADFSALTGMEANTALVRIDGNPKAIQGKVDQLTASLPQAEVKPVREITHAQTAIMGQTRSVVLTASAIVVVMIMLCMVATFTSSVLERRKDFAVMKALGASNRAVNMLFAAESSLLALAGAAAGYIAGSGIAFWIGKANFDAAILPQPVLLLPVLLGSVALALIASTAPLRLLQNIQPAGILRGE